MKRDSVVFYRSFFDIIKELKNDEKALVYDAIFEYAFDKSEVELSGMPKAVFMLAKPLIDTNNRRFENGLKGGRKTKTKPKSNQTETKTKPKANQKPTKVEPNVNVNVNDNVLKEKYTKENPTDLQIEKFNHYLAWAAEKVPKLLKIKSPLTAVQLSAIREKYSLEQFQDVAFAMEAKKDFLQKYDNLNLTMLNWLKRHFGQKEPLQKGIQMPPLPTPAVQFLEEGE